MDADEEKFPPTVNDWVSCFENLTLKSLLSFWTLLNIPLMWL